MLHFVAFPHLFDVSTLIEKDRFFSICWFSAATRSFFVFSSSATCDPFLVLCAYNLITWRIPIPRLPVSSFVVLWRWFHQFSVCCGGLSSKNLAETQFSAFRSSNTTTRLIAIFTSTIPDVNIVEMEILQDPCIILLLLK